MTVNELLHDYIEIYGKSVWSFSTYTAAVARHKNYISPIIGNMDIQDITTKFIEQYYVDMLSYPSISHPDKGVTASTINELHKLLKAAFRRAVIWKLIQDNPIEFAIKPKNSKKSRDIWTLETLKYATEKCNDPNLRLAMNIAFASTLRIGEIVGLQWDRVFLDCEHPYIYVDRIIQRVNKDAYVDLNGRDAYKVFKSLDESTNTILVMKKTKTESSVRKVYLPESLVEMFIEHFKVIQCYKANKYNNFVDHNLVFCFEDGSPIEPSRISKNFNKLVEREKLPKVCFHSLRHTSVTYKLKLTKGDIKAVQGDSGHADVKMITNVYSHILDEDRTKNAALIEENFYKKIKNDTIDEKSIMRTDDSFAKLEKFLSSDLGKRIIRAVDILLSEE